MHILKDLLEVAKKMTIKKPDDIIRQIKSILKLWPLIQINVV
ncbi:hypothetical protein [Mucilaginibacter aurantiaciroseus]|nr:hypothetical protein [Mucilaginibacter aurantiaciroseus]